MAVIMPPAKHFLDRNWNIVSSFGSPRTERMLISWSKFSKESQKWSVVGALALGGEAKGMGPVWFGEWKASGEPDSSLPQPVRCYWEGRDRLFTVVCSRRTTDNRHKLKQEVQTECKQKLFPHKDGQAS